MLLAQNWLPRSVAELTLRPLIFPSAVSPTPCAEFLSMQLWPAHTRNSYPRKFERRPYQFLQFWCTTGQGMLDHGIQAPWVRPAFSDSLPAIQWCPNPSDLWARLAVTSPALAVESSPVTSASANRH
ncbi:hypothetical protein Mapa_014732 [Marchantia paleacea]|nr:hypothetical protein Mapa_014732 [Marchantia paleacea]